MEELKTNRIRLGNLLIYKETGRALMIDAIRGENWIMVKGQKSGGIAAFDPIPLSKFWVDKLSIVPFKEEDDDDYAPRVRHYSEQLKVIFDFNSECGEVFYRGTSLKHVYYVHELQNIHLELSGFELTLTERI